METIIEKPKLTPKDFFIQLGATITLYASAGALIGLLVAIVSYVFADPVEGYAYYGSFATAGIRFAMASLIIIFPIYLVLNWLITRDEIANPAKRNLSFRRWMTFITLFLSAALVIGDLIAFLNNFLSGELTTRFVLKVVAILAVGALIFAYYIWDLRRTSSGKSGIRRIFIATSIVFVAAFLVEGFVLAGSPLTQRSLRFDERRLMDLQNIQGQVVNFWQRKERLPQTLDELEDPLSGISVPDDPATGEPYEYHILGELQFELCAKFALASSASSDADKPGAFNNPIPYGYGPNEFDNNWQHEAGRTCFQRTIDPERYPPLPDFKAPVWFDSQEPLH